MFSHFFTDLRPLGMHANARKHVKLNKATRLEVEDRSPVIAVRLDAKPTVHEYRDIRFLPRTRNADKDQQNLRRGRSDVENWRAPSLPPSTAMFGGNRKSRW